MALAHLQTLTECFIKNLLRFTELSMLCLAEDMKLLLYEFKGFVNFFLHCSLEQKGDKSRLH